MQTTPSDVDADVAVLLKEAHALLDRLDAVDVTRLLASEQGEAIAALQQLESRLTASRAKILDDWDRRDGWAAEEALSGSAWLRWRCRIPRGAASHEIHRARALREMPATTEAFRAGAITARHVGVLINARRWNAEAFDRDEELLVSFAADADQPWFEWFEAKVAMWRYVNDPDRAEQEAVDRYQRRCLRRSKGFDGMGTVDALLDPVSYEIFVRELDRIEREMWEQDWAEARARRGDAATGSDLWRTAAQRRADALVEMAKRSAAMPPDAKRARTLITALVDLPTLLGRVCELSSGTTLTPGELVPLLCECDIERAVFDSQSRLIDLGRRSRLFVGGVRRALDLSGTRCCFHRTCDLPADRCDGDHFPTAWAAGGHTDRSNGRLGCPGHHPGRRRRRQPSPPTPEDDG